MGEKVQRPAKEEGQVSHYKMRSMRPSDVPILLPLHVEQNLRDGTSYPLPRMFDEQGKLDRNIALAISMTKDDEPIQGVYFGARTVEMMFVGCNPKATLYSAREIASVRYALRAMKYEAIHTLIPKALVGVLQRPLEDAGFKRLDERFAYFYQEI
jgi:hypothetical protein